MIEDPIPEDSVPESEPEPVPEPESPSEHSVYKVLNGVQTVISLAIVMATLLTLWNPRKVFSTPSLTTLLEAQATQSVVEEDSKEGTDQHIGILAGHYGDNPGEVCADGVIESDVNYAIASNVKQLLEERGYTVDLFPEFDMSLLNYKGASLIAIYSGSCQESPLPPSGFKVAGSLTAKDPEIIDKLATCIAQEYQKATKLPFTYEVINPDQESYHIFRDINANTPAVLLELGSLKTDRQIITGKSDSVAEGIVSGIMCFLKQENKSD
jgi:N-acetylmuramoyl-L-alanine amidase